MLYFYTTIFFNKTYYTFILLISSLPIQAKHPDMQVSSLDHSGSLAYSMMDCNHEVIWQKLCNI